MNRTAVPTRRWRIANTARTARGMARRAQSTSGQRRVMRLRWPASIAPRRIAAASRRGSTRRCVARRLGSHRAEPPRVRRPPQLRTAHAIAGWRVSTKRVRPVSGSTSHRPPTSGIDSSRGSRTSITAVSCRWAHLASERRQSRGPRRSDTTTTTPRLRSDPEARDSAGANAASAPSVPDGSVRIVSSAPRRARRPPWAAMLRGCVSPNVVSARRAPRRVQRCATARTTPSATSVFRRSAVPKFIEADRSSSNSVVTERSATRTRTCGAPVRAVTFHSIQRTSSPGT